MGVALRVCTFLLLLSLLAVFSTAYDLETVARFDIDSMMTNADTACNGAIGNCNGVEIQEMLMQNDVARRNLLAARRDRYISYAAMKRNNVPCNKRGQSYYNCNRRGRANPYQRGCSYITRCKRYTD